MLQKLETGAGLKGHGSYADLAYGKARANKQKMQTDNMQVIHYGSKKEFSREEPSSVYIS